MFHNGIDLDANVRKVEQVGLLFELPTDSPPNLIFVIDQFMERCCASIHQAIGGAYQPQPDGRYLAYVPKESRESLSRILTSFGCEVCGEILL